MEVVEKGVRESVLSNHSNVFTEPLEPGRIKLCVDHSALYVAVTEITLDSACVRALLGELKALRMTKHMRMDGERQSRALPGSCYDVMNGTAGKRTASLRAKHEPGRQRLTPNLFQLPDLIAFHEVP